MPIFRTSLLKRGASKLWGPYCRRVPLVVFLLALLLPVPAQAAEPRAPWHLKDWAWRQEVVLGPVGDLNAVNTAVVDFEASPPLLATDGRDLRVVDANGNALQYQWIDRVGDPVKTPFDGSAPPRVHLHVTDPDVKTYYLYFGNPQAESIESVWEKRTDALILKTYANPGNHTPRNWAEMRTLCYSLNYEFPASDGGRRLVINDTENPYGPDERYVSIYRGRIFCPVDGTYGFATDSDDASFMLLDGRLVVSYPSDHAPSGNFKPTAECKTKTGSVYLRAGTYSIEYYHVQSGGGALAHAGWKPPWAGGYATIPADAFVRDLRMDTVIVEQRDSPLNAYFRTPGMEIIRFGGTGPVFTRVGFENTTRSALGDVMTWEWHFGDGQTSREKVPVHVFFGEGSREVTLRCVNQLSYESSWTRRVLMGIGEARRIDCAVEIDVDERFLLSDESLRLRVRCRANGAEGLPLALVTEFRSETGLALRTEREEVALKSDAWLLREVETARDGRNFLKTGTVTVRLEYLQRPVATRRVAIRRADDPTLSLGAVNGRLIGADEAQVVLRLAEKTDFRQGLSLTAKLAQGKSVRIVAVDGAWTAPGEADYLAMAAERLRLRYPEAKVTTVHVAPSGGRSGIDGRLYRYAGLTEEIALLEPDLVLVAGSLDDVMRFVPPERYERNFRAMTDRIRGATGAELCLLAPPPAVRSSLLAQRYAIAVKRVGLACGLPVADMYSTFMLAGARMDRGGGDQAAAWMVLYREESDAAPLYYALPNLRGQRMMADAVCAVLFSRVHGGS